MPTTLMQKTLMHETLIHKTLKYILRRNNEFEYGGNFSAVDNVMHFISTSRQENHRKKKKCSPRFIKIGKFV